MPRIDPALKSRLVEETQVADANGKRHRVMNWIVTPEEDQQIREGYRCPYDMQVFQEAFPESCPICELTPAREWFSPRLHQAWVYEQVSIGTHRYGGFDDDDFDYDEHYHKPKTQVLLPGRDF